MIVGDEMVVGETGRQLGQPALGKVSARTRQRRGRIPARAGTGDRVDQGQRGTVAVGQGRTRGMTRKLLEKIHWQPRRAPVVPDSLDAPAAAAPLGGQLTHEQAGAVVHFGAPAGPASQGQVAEQSIELAVHRTSLREDSIDDTVDTMNDSTVISTQEGKHAPGDWLLLIHQIPPKPDYFRVKVRRRLQRLGAVALKNSVYILPYQAETREDFEWLLREIQAEGGEATLCRGGLLAGTSDEEVEAMFRHERETDYGAIERDARSLAGRGEPTEDELGRLRRRLEETARIDHFGGPGRADAEQALADAARPASADPAPAEAGARTARGATWVTRTGIKVDRIGSAWLIRRFIDPEARFKFVPAKGYRPAAGELRFDMFQGEYTHEGDRCSFETLLARFGLADPALRALGEIVHDVDCKDEKFGRPEAAGIASLIDGLALAYPEDADRLERGAAVFEGLYAYISGGTRPRPGE